jgi:hypothetical protein
MAITVEVTPVLSDKAREQIRAIVREEIIKLLQLNGAVVTVVDNIPPGGAR